MSPNSMKSHPIFICVYIYQVYICLQEIWVRLTYLMIFCWTWYYFWAHWKNFKHKIIKFKSHAASNHVESYKNEQHRNDTKKTLWYMRYYHVISLVSYLVFAKPYFNCLFSRYLIFIILLLLTFDIKPSINEMSNRSESQEQISPNQDLHFWSPNKFLLAQPSLFCAY